MTADRTAREGLRETLAEHLWAQSIYLNTYSLSWAEAVAEAESTPRSLVWHSVDLIRKNADALLAGPLSDFLAAAEARAERMEAERDARPDEVTPDMLAAAWEVVRDRYPQGRVLGPGPGFREAITAALARRPLCDLEARLVEAETKAEVDREFAETSRRQADEARAETACLAAEVEARDAALALLLPFVDFAAGEGLHFVPDPDDDAGSMDAADLCEAAAKALGCKLGDPDYVALLSAGHEAIRTLTRTDQPEGTGSPAAAQEGSA